MPTVRALCSALENSGVKWVLEEVTAGLMGEAGGVPADAFRDEVDVAAVIGGDGTMLHALGLMGDFAKPVAGINIGTLGFLTTCKDDEVERFAEAVASGNFTTSKRTLLDAVVRREGKDETFVALNEITLARGQTGRLVSLRVDVDGELLNHYRADGLIVATPTGSTAYSLSAGGPLVEPGAGVFLVTPICPHSLSQRSLVVSDGREIVLSAEDVEDGAMLFTVDGRDMVNVEPGEVVVVRKSPRHFELLRLNGHSFYAGLRQKLGWQGG